MSLSLGWVGSNIRAKDDLRNKKCQKDEYKSSMVYVLFSTTDFTAVKISCREYKYH